MWRRAAIRLIPEYNRSLTRYDDPDTSLYHIFFDVQSDLDKMILVDDRAWLKRVFEFVEVCYEGRLSDADSWNAAGTCFLEHLADRDSRVSIILKYVKPEIFVAMWGEFKKRRDRKEAGGFKVLLEQYNEARGTAFSE